MSELLTQCPHCQTPFRVTAAQLDAAEGLVRCGSCLGLFSGNLNLIRVRPDAEHGDDALDFDEDDVALGDLDLDADAGDYEDDDTDADNDADEDEGWQPYEEYQEAGDLFAGLDTVDEADAEESGAGQLGDQDGIDDDPDADYGDDEPDDDWDDDDWDETADDEAAPLAEDEFDSSDLVDLEDEELEYEYSRIVVLEEDHDPLTDDTLDSDNPGPVHDAEANSANTLQSNPEQDELQQAESAVSDGAHRAREKSRLRGMLGSLQDDEALEPLADADLDPLEEDPVLLEAARHQRRRRLQQAGLGLASLLLLCGLVLQFVHAHLDALSQRATFAPFLPLACRLFDCPPPPGATRFGSLYSQELLIRTHPRVDDALEVSFLFRNDAEVAQPFPGLELSFRNLDNVLLANRLFRPEEYLPPELRPLGLMPADSSVQILLELVDPGPDAVNYTMAFREL